MILKLAGKTRRQELLTLVLAGVATGNPAMTAR